MALHWINISLPKAFFESPGLNHSFTDHFPSQQVKAPHAFQKLFAEINAQSHISLDRMEELHGTSIKAVELFQIQWKQIKSAEPHGWHETDHDWKISVLVCDFTDALALKLYQSGEPGVINHPGHTMKIGSSPGNAGGWKRGGKPMPQPLSAYCSAAKWWWLDSFETRCQAGVI